MLAHRHPGEYERSSMLHGDRPSCIRVVQLADLQLDEDASPEDEWRKLKDAVADASQAHLGKTTRRRRD